MTNKSSKTIVLLILTLCAAGLALSYYSNAFRATGAARFTPPSGKSGAPSHEAASRANSPGLNRLEVYGPWNWYETTWEVTVSEDGSRHCTAKGQSRFPFVGPRVTTADNFPDSGDIETIELEKDTILHRTDRFEYHLIITQNESFYGQVEKMFADGDGVIKDAAALAR